MKQYYFTNILSEEEKRECSKKGITIKDINSCVLNSLMQKSYKSFIKEESIYYIKTKNYKITFKCRPNANTIQVRSIILY